MKQKLNPTLNKLLNAHKMESSVMLFLDNPSNKDWAKSMATQLIGLKEAKVLQKELSKLRKESPMVQKEFRNMTLENIDAIKKALEYNGCVLKPVTA
jgi:hypothetical protein